jgi:hypothetical protein
MIIFGNFLIKKLKKCEKCGVKNELVDTMINPYMLAWYNKEEKITICDQCHAILTQSIMSVAEANIRNGNIEHTKEAMKRYQKLVPNLRTSLI